MESGGLRLQNDRYGLRRPEPDHEIGQCSLRPEIKERDTMELPSAFKERMKDMLKEEYNDFIESYDRERSQGLRLNLLKTGREEFMEKFPYTLEPVPWARAGFYYNSADRPGRHPFHEAGVYYIQEPSAMAVVTFLDPRPGDRVLDLCAAPGGKTTQIASALQGRGFLLTNEIHPARAKILSQNVERMGVRNGVVTNEESGRLAEYFPEYFDRIVVDAPCSGEGMFRKDEEAVREWSPGNVERCAVRQQEILYNAARMLKPGGRLVYSTCTFAPMENEMTIEAFIESHPEFSIEKTEDYEGLSKGVKEWGNKTVEGIENTVRIWPQRTEGEGHYIAVLRKDGTERDIKRKWPAYIKDRKVLKDYFEFCRSSLTEPGQWTDRKNLILFGEQLYLIPEEMPDFDKLKVVRPGLHLGSFKKNRFEPSHALALALKKEEVGLCRDYPADSPETAAYLKGEAIADEHGQPGDKGWTLMNVEGYSLGWAKLAGGILKNHYPKGLRK